jgi:hypothetical protein
MLPASGIYQLVLRFLALATTMSPSQLLPSAQMGSSSLPRVLTQLFHFGAYRSVCGSLISSTLVQLHLCSASAQIADFSLPHVLMVRQSSTVFRIAAFFNNLIIPVNLLPWLSALAEMS